MEPKRLLMIIRKAKESDADALIQMGKAMHKENSFASMPFDEEKTKAFFDMTRVQELAIVAEHEGKIVGMLGAGIRQHFFSCEPMAVEYLVYVIPEWRGTRTAERLLNVYVTWARENGVKEGNVNIGINAGSDTARIERFYNKLGFKRTGVLMRM